MPDEMLFSKMKLTYQIYNTIQKIFMSKTTCTNSTNNIINH